MDHDELKKALHKIVMKAYRKGQESISKEHAVNHIVHDLEDPNKKPQVPKSHVPAASESVLHKEMKPGQAVSEMHNQKQMNAQASLGMRPGAGGAAKPPKMGGGMPKPMGAPAAAPAGAGAPAGASGGGGKPKAPKPLKNFMMRMSEKRGGAPMAKAKVDQGKDLQGKVAARQERNERDVKVTKTPSGQNTRTARSGHRRESELEHGGSRGAHALGSQGKHAERRHGEKIVGTPKDIKGAQGPAPEKKFGVHMHSGTMSGKNLPLGGKHGAAPVSADKEGKTYRTGGHSGAHGAHIRHQQVMEGLNAIKAALPKSEPAAKVPMAKANSLPTKEKGVNKPYHSGSGISEQGYTVRGGMRTVGTDQGQEFRNKKTGGDYDRGLARDKAKRTLSEQRAMPKPNLKAEKAPAGKLKKDMPAPTPPPAPGGQTINSQIGFPFGKKELTTQGREHIKAKNFALGGGRYPIHDAAHARNALARVAQHGTPEEQARVRAAVARKYPGLSGASDKKPSKDKK